MNSITLFFISLTSLLFFIGWIRFKNEKETEATWFLLAITITAILNGLLTSLLAVAVFGNMLKAIGL